MKNVSEFSWQHLQNGTHRLFINPLSIDVFAFCDESGAIVWRWVISQTKGGFAHFVATNDAKTEECAKQDSVVEARKILHPVID